jgi:hypothetical protein
MNDYYERIEKGAPNTFPEALPLLIVGACVGVIVYFFERFL